MTEKTFIFTVSQWPTGTNNVEVKIVAPAHDDYVIVEAVQGHPFTDTYNVCGSPTLAHDVFWYKSAIVNRSRLIEIEPESPADVAGMPEPIPGAIGCPCADCEAKRQNLIAKGFGGLAKKIQHPRTVVPDTRTPEQIAKFKAEQERRNRNFKPSSPTHM